MPFQFLFPAKCSFWMNMMLFNVFFLRHNWFWKEEEVSQLPITENYQQLLFSIERSWPVKQTPDLSPNFPAASPLKRLDNALGIQKDDNHNPFFNSYFSKVEGWNIRTTFQCDHFPKVNRDFISVLCIDESGWGPGPKQGILAPFFGGKINLWPNPTTNWW